MPKWPLWIAVAIAMIVIPSPPRAATPANTTDRLALPDIVAPLLGAVVNITVLKRAAPATPGAAVLAEAGRPQRSVGSGFIIDPAGHIVTNRHVVAGAYKITVTLHDERQFAARVLASNTTPDLALIKIDAPGALPVVAWGDSEALRIGETVMVVGNPLGLATSVTVGVVSALNRNITRSSMIDHMIQTDAAINRGNSGGPMFNLRGEVVGVNWAIVTPNDDSGSVGLGLAIPADTAAIVVDHMRRFGRLRAGFFGMAIQPLTPELARAVGLTGTEGGIITAIVPGGPADRIGLNEGDVLLQLGPKRTNDARALMRQLADFPAGTVAPIRVWQRGRMLSLDLPLEAFPPIYDPVGPSAIIDRGPRSVSATLGLTLSPRPGGQPWTPTSEPQRPGLRVDAVAPNSVAEDLGLGAGDVILRANDTLTRTLEQFTTALARVPPGGPTLLQVILRDEIQWLVVPAVER